MNTIYIGRHLKKRSDIRTRGFLVIPLLLLLCVTTNCGKVRADEMISSVKIRETVNREGKVYISAEFGVSDPGDEIKTLEIALLPKEAIRESHRPAEDGSIVMLGKSTKDYKKCYWRGQTATTSFNLEGEPGTVQKYVFQLCLLDRKGRRQFLEPSPLEVTFYEEEPRFGPALSIPGINEFLEVTTPGTSLLGEHRGSADADIYKINLPNKGLAEDFLWYENGDSLFVLYADGTMLQVSIPQFRVVKQTHLKHKYGKLGISSEGLVVLLYQQHELRIIDPVKLAYKGVINCGDVDRIYSSSNSKFAFGICTDDDSEYLTNEFYSYIAALDVKNLTVDEVYKPVDLCREKSNIRVYPGSSPYKAFVSPAMTTDGKYLFSIYSSSLHRFRITGTELLYEEVGPPIVGQKAQIAISGDDNYIAVPGRADTRPEGFPGIGNGGVYIFKTTDLATPVAAIPMAAPCKEFAFDKAGKRMYAMTASDNRANIVAFSSDGKKIREYAIPWKKNDVFKFLPHPSGKKMVIQSGRFLYWMVFDY
ncbi:MAG: hypothetical protein GY765_17150 [bacterium]|nr:hypothetical protein [bacterium]